MAKEKKYFVTASPHLNIREGPGTDYEVVGTVPQGEKILSPNTEGWVPIILEDDTIGWVSGQFLKEAPAEEPTPAEPVPAELEGDPPWIVWAKKQLGTKELPGAGDNPEIISWFELTTLPKNLWHDSTAWCAVFVNAGFFLNGVKGLRSARAADWLEFGQPVENPETGDVVVFEWRDGSHHVAYFLDQEDDRVRVIGGNQSNAVTETTYPMESVAGFRRPPGHIKVAPKAAPVAEHDFSTKEDTIAAIKAECQKQGIGLPAQVAYVLATTEWETGHTFKPIREKGPDSYFDRYEGREDLGNVEPGDGLRFKGRGFVQITGRNNYQHYARVLGIDLVGDPDLALEPKTAAFILVDGFKTGAFTGKKITDYINAQEHHFIEARRCVNGLDHAQDIAVIAKEFLEA